MNYMLRAHDGKRQYYQPMSEFLADKDKITQDMKIRHAQESDRLQWDDFVHRHPESSPYHLFAWTAAVEGAYGFKISNLIAERDNRVVGVLPLVQMNLPFMKPNIIALPYCDIGGVLAEDDATEESLIQAGIAEAKSILANMIELRGEFGKWTGRENTFSISSHTNKVRMLLDLPVSSEMLWDGFKSKLRSQIRRAEKNGLVFEFANKRIDDFYSVFSNNMRELGSPVHSKKWFEEIVKQYGDNAKVGLVYHDSKAIGAAIILRAGNKISIPWASTLRDYNRLSPNMLLYWGMLKYSADNGADVFDFGRSTPDEGTYRFKAQWGAIAAPLVWNTIFVNGKEKVVKPGINRNRKVIESIWKRLPLGWANMFGPTIRKYISL